MLQDFVTCSSFSPYPVADLNFQQLKAGVSVLPFSILGVETLARYQSTGWSAFLVLLERMRFYNLLKM